MRALTIIDMTCYITNSIMFVLHYISCNLTTSVKCFVHNVDVKPITYLSVHRISISKIYINSYTFTTAAITTSLVKFISNVNSNYRDYAASYQKKDSKINT